MTGRFDSLKCRFARLIPVALLAGCTGFLPGLPDDYQVGADPEKGVIVGSVGTNPLGNPWREYSRYDFRSANDPKLRGHVTSAVNWSNPFYPQPECADDGLPDECASLFAILLPAGEYEFRAVIPAMDSNAADRSFSQSGWTALLQGYRFEVKPGQVTYVGNLLSRLCGGTSHSYYGIARIGSARSAQGDIGDMYDRDMPLIRVKFPQLQGARVNNETMAGMAWRWEYKQSDQQSATANWRADCAPLRDNATALAP